MATQRPDPDGIREPCARCSGETVHEVHVEIRTESTAEENAQFSREPYRVSTCQECGSESVLRMNDA
ncbi:MAG: hypothetical protein ABEH47_06315 [Haloferacaceae archaeon]